MPGPAAAAGWLEKMYSKKRAAMEEAHSLREASMTRVVVADTGPPVCELTTADTEATMPAGDEQAVACFPGGTS
jgi:electron transfer flavoprotein alpha/beta subunit